MESHIFLLMKHFLCTGVLTLAVCLSNHPSLAQEARDASPTSRQPLQFKQPAIHELLPPPMTAMDVPALINENFYDVPEAPAYVRQTAVERTAAGYNIGLRASVAGRYFHRRP